MIIVLKRTSTIEEQRELIGRIESMGLTVKDAGSEHHGVLGLIGDTTKVDITQLEAHHIVEKVMKVQEPYKLASRTFQPMDTVINVDGHLIGGGNLTIIGGPCSVESEDQIMSIAREVKKSGAHILRGAHLSLEHLLTVSKDLVRKVLNCFVRQRRDWITNYTEAMSTEEFDIVEEYADIIQNWC